MKKYAFHFFYVLAIFLMAVAIILWSSPAAFVARSYESYNDRERSSDPGNTLQSIALSKLNTLEPVTATQARSISDGVLLFGFPTCPYCRNLMPELVDAAKETETPIYYCEINRYSDRYEYHSGLGQVVKTLPAGEGYYALLDWLRAFLPDYKVLDETGAVVDLYEKRILSPTVITIRDGVPVDNWKLSDVEGIVYPENKYERWDEMVQNAVRDSLRSYFQDTI